VKAVSRVSDSTDKDSVAIQVNRSFLGATLVCQDSRDGLMEIDDPGKVPFSEINLVCSSLESMVFLT
jgi:hypothetical protein